MKLFLAKFKESAFSVLPITVLVLVIGLSAGVVGGDELWRFLLGGLLLIVGMSFFNAGADVAMVETGNLIGAELTKTKKLWLVIVICFLVGILVTVAEPDLMVLAEQLADIMNGTVLIVAVGVGVGLFMAVAILRIIFQLSLRSLLLVLYAAVFVLAIFVPKEFLPLSFDSGGVTTGPMTVPFIMALGVGVAASKKGGNMDDSFGIVALCSVGPIVAVMILGIIYGQTGVDMQSAGHAAESAGILMPFVTSLPAFLKEVAIALLPVIGFIAVFNFIRLKLSKKALAKIGIGFVNVYLGLVIFLTGVNIGFAPVGRHIGEGIVRMGLGWLLIPVAFVMGLFTVLAEPAVHVLTEQIEEISGGSIKKRSIRVALMLGVGAALALAMVRVLTGISIWWMIVPGYVIALLLTLFVPKVFTAIAFDSGGVASGPMTAAFILPFAVGASLASGGNIYTDAFGVVAFVAMTPLIAIQIVGLISLIKNKKKAPILSADVIEEVIDFDKEASKQPLQDAQNEDIIDFDMEHSSPAQRAVRVVRTALAPKKKSVLPQQIEKHAHAPAKPPAQKKEKQNDPAAQAKKAKTVPIGENKDAVKALKTVQENKPIIDAAAQPAVQESKKEGV